VLKVAGATPAAPAPSAPSAPSAEPTPSADDFGPEMDTEAPQSSSNEKPFEDTPFDAGVEADEETDPKKFIEQLTGKLGQSLRKYTEEQGQPDFELEKFAINSLISATHTSEMDEEDKNDIIKKINQAGEKDSEPEASMDSEPSAEAEPSADSTGGEEAPSDAKPVDEMSNLFVDAKKNNMFQPNSNDILKEDGENTEDFSVGDIVSMQGSSSKWKITGIVKPNSVGQIRIFITRIEDDGTLSVSTETSGKISSPPSPRISKISGINENMGESNNYMFWSSLKTIAHASGELLEMDKNMVDRILSNGHGWALDHIATSNDDMEEVYHFLANTLNAYDGDSEGGYEDEYGNVEDVAMYEGKYDGKPLGKPMKGDVKKFKVYVRNKKGNVIKVNFGDPNMEIKRDNPKRRKSFRARHKCSQAKDRTTPKYWSCKMWSKKPVSKIVEENLINSEKFSIFDKKTLLNKLHESLNQDIMYNAEPQTLPSGPKTKPAETQPVQPTRRQKTFLPEIETQPDPKAKQ